jgi:hypothetical protein
MALHTQRKEKKIKEKQDAIATRKETKKEKENQKFS